MYKIFIKYKTNTNAVDLYDCYREENEDGDLVEFESNDLLVVKEKVTNLVKKYLFDDIYVHNVANVKYLFNIDGTEPEEEVCAAANELIVFT